jgi:hypothetical protein
LCFEEALSVLGRLFVSLGSGEEASYMITGEAAAAVIMVARARKCILIERWYTFEIGIFVKWRRECSNE